MMPFRGYPYSNSGKDRKNIPPTTIPTQPTPPAFNIPPPTEVVPPVIPPVAPPVTTTPPTVEIPPSTPVMPPSPPMPVMPPMPCMPPMTCMPPMPQFPPSCPFMCGHMMPDMCGMPGMCGMPDMNYMDMDDFMDISLPPSMSDPPPILSNNPAVLTTSLFKELTGYPNYGNPSGNADILYTGNRGTWTFDVPQGQFGPGNQRGQLVIRAVLDDHPNVPIRQYSLRITVNGIVVHNGPVPLSHGTPAGAMFNNWSSLTFNLANLRRNTRVVIENTSTAGPNDWIAFDWMELRLSSR